MKKIIILVGLITIFCNCIGPKTLQYKLNLAKYPLGYLHDSPKVENKLNISLFPEIIDISNSNCLTHVIKDTKNSFKAFTVYQNEYTIELGICSVSPDLTEFICNSFIKESERSGKYLINDTSVDKAYNVLIEISEVDVKSNYHEDNGSGFYVDVSPSTGKLKFNVKLFDSKNMEVFSNKYECNRISGFAKTRFSSENNIFQAMMQNQAETLNQCIKENISNMVADINLVIGQLPE